MQLLLVESFFDCGDYYSYFILSVTDTNIYLEKSSYIGYYDLEECLYTQLFWDDVGVNTKITYIGDL